MKKIVFILFLFFAKQLVSQISFNPVFLNQCTNESENVPWLLKDSTKFYKADVFNFSKVELNKLGQYELYVDLEENPIEINIDKNGITRDTFFLKKIKFVSYISNPPISEYQICDSLANGKGIDFFRSGIRMKGEFVDGQPIDSLFTFYRNGKISEIFIPNKDDWKKFTYYKNGTLHLIYDTKNKFETEFYEDGQTKVKRTWSNKNRSKRFEFYNDGKTKVVGNNKKIKWFNDRGQLVEKIKIRKLKFIDKIKSKIYFDHFNEQYRHIWKSYDDNGVLIRKIIFNKYDYFLYSTQARISEIDIEMFKEVFFYKHGTEDLKIDFTSVLENRKYQPKLYIYRKHANNWIKENEMK